MRKWLEQKLKYGGQWQEFYKVLVNPLILSKWSTRSFDVYGDKILKGSWKLIEKHALLDQELTNDGESPDETSGIPKERKAKWCSLHQN